MERPSFARMSTEDHGKKVVGEPVTNVTSIEIGEVHEVRFARRGGSETVHLLTTALHPGKRCACRIQA